MGQKYWGLLKSGLGDTQEADEIGRQMEELEAQKLEKEQALNAKHGVGYAYHNIEQVIPAADDDEVTLGGEPHAFIISADGTKRKFDFQTHGLQTILIDPMIARAQCSGLFGKEGEHIKEGSTFSRLLK